MCCDLPPFTSQSKEAARTPLNIGSGQLEQSGVRQWKEETFGEKMSFYSFVFGKGARWIMEARNFFGSIYFHLV